MIAERTFNFDKIVDRRNTNSIKYDFALERKGREDLLPLWVADMDFPLPEEILEEIKHSVSKGIFGYSDPKEDYFLALQNWFSNQFGWKPEREWNTITPGVVYAIATAIRAFSKEGDAVLIQEPVYYPFRQSIINNRRKCINSQLVYEDGAYHIDFADFEAKVVENQVKLFILCSPHNPVGRVWNREELERIGEICIRHQVLIIADEIHCDFVYAGKKFIPFASMGERFANQSIVCTSPSKTFNVAGLQVSNILISNPKLRERFRREHAATGYSQGNALGIKTAQTVYEKGAAWQEALKVYLAENLAYVRTFLKEHLPQIKLVEPEGTYLLWLDCSGLGLSEKELEQLFVNEAKLWLDEGSLFSKETALFERMNIACPRSIVEQALLQLKEAVDKK